MKIAPSDAVESQKGFHYISPVFFAFRGSFANFMDKEQYFLECIHEADGEELSKLGLNVLENPEQCVKVLLEQMRSGNDEFKFVLSDLLFHGYGQGLSP